MPQAHKKILYFLPNLFTALNMGCGFLSCILTWKQEFFRSSCILLLGTIFDSVDGKVARLLGGESNFGEQFDSMSDVISFGMAPALLYYHYYFAGFGRVGMALCFIFLLCTALRLARFNSNIDRVDPRFFQGLPSPVGALGLVGLVLFSLELDLFKTPPLLPALFLLLTSFLMISNVSFYSFKDSRSVKKNKKLTLVIFLLLAISIFTFFELAIVAAVSLYILLCIIYFFSRQGGLKEAFRWSDGG